MGSGEGGGGGGGLYYSHFVCLFLVCFCCFGGFRDYIWSLYLSCVVASFVASLSLLRFVFIN